MPPYLVIPPAAASPAKYPKASGTPTGIALPNLAVGVQVTPAANAYSAAWVQLVAATPADLYIVGCWVDAPTVTFLYAQVLVGLGAAGAEAQLAMFRFGKVPTGVLPASWCPAPFPIPVANGSRLAIKSAADVNTGPTRVQLYAVAQADVGSIVLP